MNKEEIQKQLSGADLTVGVDQLFDNLRDDLPGVELGQFRMAYSDELKRRKAAATAEVETAVDDVAQDFEEPEDTAVNDVDESPVETETVDEVIEELPVE